MTLEQLRKEARDALEASDEANRKLDEVQEPIREAVLDAGLEANIPKIQKEHGLNGLEEDVRNATNRSLAASRALLEAELGELRQRDDELQKGSERGKEDADIGTDLDRSPHTHHHADVKPYPRRHKHEHSHRSRVLHDHEHLHEKAAGS